MRLGASIIVAAALATASWSELAASAEVKYPGPKSAHVAQRLSVAVAPAAVLAFEARAAPILSASATVATVGVLHASVEASYPRPIARAVVEIAEPEAQLVFVDLEAGARGGGTASVLPHSPHAAALVADAIVSRLELLAPFVAQIDSALLFDLAFADFVIVQDFFINVRSESPFDLVLADDSLAWILARSETDSVAPADTAASSIGKPFSDAISAVDLFGFEIFLDFGIGDWTSPLDGAALHEYPLHDDNKASIVVVSDHIFLLLFEGALHLGVGPTSPLHGVLLNVGPLHHDDTGDFLYVTDHTPLVDFIKPLTDSTSAADMRELFVGKELTDAAVPAETHIVDYVHGGFFDTLTPIDDILFGFLFDLRLGVGPTSPLDGTALNEWVLHADDVGDFFYATEHTRLVDVTKPLTDSASAADVLDPFFFGQALTDAPVATEALVVNYVPATLQDSVTPVDDLLFGFDLQLRIYEAFTSPLHGDGMLLNDQALNENNYGDGLMPFDVLIVDLSRPLTDSVMAVDVIEPFIHIELFINAAPLNETPLN